MEMNKTCLCCGKKYSYCPTCGADSLKPSWYNLFHEENCEKLFYITADYIDKKITKDEAKKAFGKCLISDVDQLHHNVRDVINEVMIEEKVETKIVSEEIIEEPIVEEKSKSRRRRKNK